MDLDSERAEGRSSGGVDGGEGEPEVVLETPMLRVGALLVKARALRARLSVHARVANLLTLEIGPDVDLCDAELRLNEAEAQGRLCVRLQRVYRIIERSLETIERHPQILQFIANRQPMTGASVKAIAELIGSALAPLLSKPRLVWVRAWEIARGLGRRNR